VLLRLKKAKIEYIWSWDLSHHQGTLNKISSNTRGGGGCGLWTYYSTNNLHV